MIDSHAHLTTDVLFDDLDGILERLKDTGVERVINICTDILTLERGLELANRDERIVNVAAATPHDVQEIGETFYLVVKKVAKDGKLVAIGETGLDYYYEHSPKILQQDHLRRYLALALEVALPVVIHCREAFDDFISIIDECYQGAPGVLHCFTGTMDEAKRLLDRGFYISFSGIVTFKKSAELQEVAKMVPLDRMLIETDAPYLAPQSRRGKRNESSYLPEIAAFIANLKGIAVEEVISATKANTKALFNL